MLPRRPRRNLRARIAASLRDFFHIRLSGSRDSSHSPISCRIDRNLRARNFSNGVDETEEIDQNRSDLDISKDESIDHHLQAKSNAIDSRARLLEALKQLEIEQDRRYVEDIEYVHLLESCQNLRDLDAARRLHAQIVRASLDNRVFLGNHLIYTYGKCRSLDDARKTFEAMTYKNLHTWTAIIGVCSQQHCHSLAMILFRNMLLDGVRSDKITLLSVLTSCDSSESLDAGKLIHGFVAETGNDRDLILGNALVSMYARCGSVGDAKRVFDSMPDRNVITWTAMIGAYAAIGLEKALKIFREMELEGFKSNFITFVTIVQACSKPEFVEVGIFLHNRSIESSKIIQTPLCNALITMYGRCNRLKDARGIFAEMLDRDIITWNAMITEYAQHGIFDDAVLLYQYMLQEGIKPDKRAGFGSTSRSVLRSSRCTQNAGAWKRRS